MPRNVRNFWLELEVDGRKAKVATGPRRSDGGFRLTILIRKDGNICQEEVVIRGDATGDGNLIITSHQYVNGERRTVKLHEGRR